MHRGSISSAKLTDAHRGDTALSIHHSYSVGLGPDLELQVVDVLQVAAGTREEEGGGGDVGLWEEQS
jgi:hypothetical protein